MALTRAQERLVEEVRARFGELSADVTTCVLNGSAKDFGHLNHETTQKIRSLGVEWEVSFPK